MRAWRQSHDQHSSPAIAESRNRLPPVLVVTIRPAADAGDLFSPFDQPGTLAAGDDSVIQLFPIGFYFGAPLFI
jgi:hypothetical protein